MKPLEFANLLKPTHCRTGCSDDNRINGFGSAEISSSKMMTDADGVRWTSEPKKLPYFRCQRCAILDILAGDEKPSQQMLDYLAASSCNDIILAAYRFENR